MTPLQSAMIAETYEVFEWVGMNNYKAQLQIQNE